jgi:hypothetical protein
MWCPFLETKVQALGVKRGDSVLKTFHNNINLCKAFTFSYSLIFAIVFNYFFVFKFYKSCSSVICFNVNRNFVGEAEEINKSF